MDFKNFINNLFKYNNTNNYNFSIAQDVNDIPSVNNKYPNVFSNYKDNLDFVKSKYNTLINSDIIIREVDINVNSKIYKCTKFCYYYY